MRISPTFPAPLKVILVVGIGCVLAGMELSESQVTKLRPRASETATTDPAKAAPEPVKASPSTPR